jgi:hypothetical protein
MLSCLMRAEAKGADVITWPTFFIMISVVRILFLMTSQTKNLHFGWI